LIALRKAKELLGIPFNVWPGLLDISPPTFGNILIGTAPITFTTLTAIQRIAVLLDVPPNAVTDHQLPLIPRAVVEGDIARLRELRDSAYVADFCDRRLREIASGEVIDRPDALTQPGAVQLAIPRVAREEAQS
jgi:hypothetical protein